MSKELFKLDYKEIKNILKQDKNQYVNDTKKMFKVRNSLIGVTIEDERININTLKGKDIDINSLQILMLKHFPDLLKKGYELNKKRTNKYKIFVHEGMSGCRDIYVQFLKNIDGFDVFHNACKVHVSMIDKFNEGINNIWLGDFVLILDYLRDNDSLLEEDIYIKEIDIIDSNKNDFNYINDEELDEKIKAIDELINQLK